MYAVIKTGGKQYRVVAGQKLKVEQIPADIGATITFNEVLAVGSGADLVVGSPLVAGAKVDASVLAQGKGDKVRIFKLRRRKHYQKHGGHRQLFTEIMVSGIFGADGKALATAEAPLTTAVPAKGRATRGKKRDGSDNLEMIEGIGPKIAAMLKAEGIDTFAALAATPADKLQGILDAGGSKFNLANPSTWSEQAALAAKGDWAAFDKLTAELVGGVRK